MRAHHNICYGIYLSIAVNYKLPKGYSAENFDGIDKFAGKGIIKSRGCDEKFCAEEIEKNPDMINMGERKEVACPVCWGFSYKIRIAKVYFCFYSIMIYIYLL